MSVSIQCPNPVCAKVALAPATVVGQVVRCKSCGRSFVAGTTVDGGTDGRASNEPAAPRTIVGRFELKNRVGAGAFGTVYHAYDPHLDREVAVKVANPGVLTDPKRVERFLREARAAAQLRHPHIVPVYDAGRDGDDYYIAAAFVEGKPLTDTIEQKDTGFCRAAQLVQQLADALAYAHDLKIVHRDVKPGNVLVDADGRVHLLDFGLASREDEAKVTSDGAVMGTPAYMAPEQAAGQTAAAGPAADQYAAGVVLYELLTGRVPFDGPAAVVLHNTVHTPPERPSKLRADVPRDLETICLKAMAKRPEDRYPSCQALADDLRRWLEGEPITARRLSTVEQLARWTKQNRTVAALATGLVAALGIGVVVSSVFAVQASFHAARADQEAETARIAQSAAEANARNEADARARMEIEKRAAEEAKTQAEHARQRAEAALLTAEQEKQRADAERLAADRERQKSEVAVAGQRKADQAAADAQALAAKAQQNAAAKAYTETIQRVQDFIRLQQFPDAAALLDEIAAADRGWEWRFLKRWADTKIVPLTPLAGFEHHLQSQALSPDGKQLAMSVRAGGTTGRPGPQGKSWPVDPHGRFDVHVYIRDVVTNKKTRLLHEVTFKVNQLAFSPEGAFVAAFNDVGAPFVWDATSGKQVLPKKSQKVQAFTFAADGRRLAVGIVAKGGEIATEFWELPSGKVLGSFRIDGPTTEVTKLVYADEDRVLVVAWSDGTIQLRDAESGEIRRTIPPEGAVRAMSCSKNGRRLFLVRGRAAEIVDVTTGRGVWRETLRGDNEMPAMSPDGARVARLEPAALRLQEIDGGRLIYLSLTVLGQEAVHVIPVLRFTDDGNGLVLLGNVNLRAANARTATARLGTPSLPAGGGQNAVMYLGSGDYDLRRGAQRLQP